MAVIPDFPHDLLDIHHNWHQPGAHPGSGPGRLIPSGDPGSGIEFLEFHREFQAEFHTWYDSQPFADPAAVAAWPAIPPELRDPAVTFWNDNLAQQELRITRNVLSFTTADDLGIFIENGIHNWIHGAAARVYNEPEVASFHSPLSTYFYQIHGMIDLWWDLWEQGHVIVNQNARLKDIVDAVDVKRFVKENIKEKDKDKDLIEGLTRPGDDLILKRQLGGIGERINVIERQLGIGRSFIRRHERPEVGRTVVEDGHDEG